MDDRAALRETGDAESDPTPHQDATVPDFEAARNVEAAQDTPRPDNDVDTPNAGTGSTPSTIKDSVKIGSNTNNEQEIAPAQSQDGAPMSKDQEGNEPEKNPDDLDRTAGFEQDEGEETDQADEADKDGAPQPATHDPGAKAPVAKSQNLLQDAIRENEPVKKEKKEKNTMAIDLSRPTWIRVNRKWLLPETLDDWDLPWEWDIDSEYILIKQYVDSDLLDTLFEHTSLLKEREMLLKERRMRKERRMKDVIKELLASDSETKPPCEDHSGNEVSDGDVPRQSDRQTHSHGFNGSNIDIDSGLSNNRFANGIATARNSSVPNICTYPGRATASTPQSSIRAMRREDSSLQDERNERNIKKEMAHAAESIYREGPLNYLQRLHRANILLARAMLYDYRDESVINYDQLHLHYDIKRYMEAVEMYRSFLSKDQIPPKDQAVRIWAHRKVVRRYQAQAKVDPSDRNLDQDDSNSDDKTTDDSGDVNNSGGKQPIAASHKATGKQKTREVIIDTSRTGYKANSNANDHSHIADGEVDKQKEVNDERDRGKDYATMALKFLEDNPMKLWEADFWEAPRHYEPDPSFWDFILDPVRFLSKRLYHKLRHRFIKSDDDRKRSKREGTGVQLAEALLAKQQGHSRLITALASGAALIAPMLIMVLHATVLTRILTTCIFTIAAALVLAFFMKDSSPQDIATATAAYAAVLIVFIGAGFSTVT